MMNVRWNEMTCARRALVVILASCALLVSMLPLLPVSRAQAADFLDTPASSWYVRGGYLDYVVDNGLMVGTKNPDGSPTGLFDPEGNLTRAQAAIVIYRYCNPGSLATTERAYYGAVSSFSDVRTRAYYTEAIEWCYQNGIITGYYDAASDSPRGTFGPDDPVTREQLATMVYRLAVYLGVSTEVDSTAAWDAMVDTSLCSRFALEAARWCASHGIITGDLDGGAAYLNPQGLATRAQMAKIVTVLIRDVLQAPATYAVTFVSDGSVLATLRLELGQAIVAPEVAPKDDYDFAGWSPSLAEGAVCTGDATYNAVWVEAPMYALLYDNGSLVFQRGTFNNEGAGLVEAWTGYEYAGTGTEKDPGPSSACPWLAYAGQITRVSVEDPYAPPYMSYWFSGLAACNDFNLGLLDTSQCLDMTGMFRGCTSLVSLDLRGWDIGSCMSTSFMFRDCSALAVLDVSGWQTPSLLVTSSMFAGCGVLGELDLSSWDLSDMRSMAGMFTGCTALSTVVSPVAIDRRDTGLPDTTVVVAPLTEQDAAGSAEGANEVEGGGQVEVDATVPAESVDADELVDAGEPAALPADLEEPGDPAEASPVEGEPASKAADVPAAPEASTAPVEVPADGDPVSSEEVPA